MPKQTPDALAQHDRCLRRRPRPREMPQHTTGHDDVAAHRDDLQLLSRFIVHGDDTREAQPRRCFGRVEPDQIHALQSTQGRADVATRGPIQQRQQLTLDCRTVRRRAGSNRTALLAALRGRRLATLVDLVQPQIDAEVDETQSLLDPIQTPGVQKKLSVDQVIAAK